MKPWMALSVVFALLGGCASGEAPLVRCNGPWQELPRVSGDARDSSLEPKAAGRTRGSDGAHRVHDATLVGDADQKPRVARQSSDGDVSQAEAREVFSGK